MALATAQGRITSVPYQRGIPVDTFWDLGRSDQTAIWFVQHMHVRRHAINFYENTGYGVDHYLSVLQDLAEEHGLCGPWPPAKMVGREDGHVFSPRESQADRYREKRAARVTPMTPSQRRRDLDRCHSYGRRKEAGPCWTSQSAQHNIYRECKRWRIPSWHLNQLRHTYATEVRAAHGLEAAQAILGHSRADVTQVYAERDLTLAARVAAAMG
jgi:hypothetical protein